MDVDKEQWQVLENEARHASIFQTYAWAKVLKSIGTEPRFVMMLNQGTPIIGLLLLKGSFMSRVFHGYEAMSGPLVTSEVDEGIFSSFASTLEFLMRKESTLYFYWNPSFFFDLDPFLSAKGFFPIPSATFVVDLRLPVEALWRNLEKRARWGVKKAQEKKVTVEEARDWESWSDYRNMYVYENYRKRVRPRSIQLFRHIFEFLLPEEKVKLFVARHSGKIIAGGLFLMTPHEMIYYENASDSRYLGFQPNNAIQWHAILWAKEQGIRYYDLGGALGESDEGHFLLGVHVFKRQWGGRLYRYNSFALNRFYAFGRKLIKEKPSIVQLYYTLEKLGMIKRSDRI